MLVKILCSCGTKYSFDVEPVNGQMPGSVKCPNCGVDGTEAANEYARQVSAARPTAVTVPTPPAMPAATAATPAVPGRIAPSAGSGPAPRKKRGYGEPNMTLGIAGAVGAALIGMAVWYGIIVATKIEFGIIAWAVGGFIGLGCRLLSGGYSQKLGIIAGSCAFVAIVGGEFLATRSAFNTVIDKMMDGAYEARLEVARQADTVESDAQIREFLSKHGGEEDDTPIPEDQVTSEMIKDFRTSELPKLKEFAKGKPSKAEFEREIRDHFNSPEMQKLILKESVSLWTLLWLFLGVGSAYRLGVGETE